jgi:hypothetical protein
MRQLTLIGKYTQSKLWPFLSEATGAMLPNWEFEWSRSNPTLPIQLFTTLPPAVAFVAPPMLALLLSYTSVVKTSLYPIWSADVGVCAGLATLALIFTLAEIRLRWSEREDSAHADSE